jgi:sugar phosphate permease
MRGSVFSGSSKRLFLLCFFTYSVIYIGRKNFSVCIPGMVELGVIDKVLGGTTGTAFLAVYACGQLINGLLGDRVNPKYMMAGGLMGAAAANIAMGVNRIPALFPVIWGINGYCCSMIWAPLLRSLSENLNYSERQAAGAAISSAIPTGTVISYLVCAVVLSVSDWRVAFISCGAILAVSSVLLYVNLTALSKQKAAQHTPEHAAVPAVETGAENEAVSGHLAKLKHMSLPLLVISTGLYFSVGGILFNGILKDGLDLWLPSYISEYFHMDDSVAAALSAVLPIVNISGIYFARFLNLRYIRNELGTCAVLFAVSAVSFIPLVLISLSGVRGALSAVAAVLLISITSAAMLGINSMFLTFIPFRFAQLGRSASVTGFLNFSSYAAASLSGVTIGLISSGFGWTVTVISFAVISVSGAAICAAGMRIWKESADILSGGS